MVLVKTQSPGEGVFSDGQFLSTESLGILIGAGVSGLLSLISIFLFKERTFQILLAAISSLLQLFSVIGWCFLTVSNAGKLNEFAPGPGLYVSMAGIILIWLATRAIRKDEALIKSMDRLR